MCYYDPHSLNGDFPGILLYSNLWEIRVMAKKYWLKEFVLSALRSPPGVKPLNFTGVFPLARSSKIYFGANINFLLLQQCERQEHGVKTHFMPFIAILLFARITALKIMSKQLFTLEYSVRCSPSILYEFLATPAGLQEWFADRVDERDQVYSFTWNGTTDKAQVLESETDKSIKFHWLHTPKNEYFEFRIEKAEVSNQTILQIRDFAEKKDIPDQKRLWDFQVNDLLHRLGN